jgi:hypothetical protein
MRIPSPDAERNSKSVGSPRPSSRTESSTLSSAPRATAQHRRQIAVPGPRRPATTNCPLRRKLVREAAATASAETPTIRLIQATTKLHDMQYEVVRYRIFGARPKRGITQAPAAPSP